MRSVGAIRIADFDYELPDNRVPRHPLATRDACRLLVSDARGELTHRRFADLPDLIAAGSLLVCNNTRVINARIRFRKPTGAEIETFLLEPESPADYALALAAEGQSTWRCLVGGLKRWKSPSISRPVDEAPDAPVLTATRRGTPGPDGATTIEFTWTPANLSFADIVQRAGFIPIPPYLKRQSEASDASDYQTTYSKIEGSVAAPTAGLHFTPALFGRLAAGGIRTAELTLHVGAGTFRPVKADAIGEHTMHTETFVVERAVLSELMATLREGREVVAVGTTSVRTLESLPYLGAAVMRGEEPIHVNQWEAYDTAPFATADALQALADYMDKHHLPTLAASTAIIIAPGFEWRIVSRMITNFHQPRSTLLLLVSAFLNPPSDATPTLQWRKIYDAALDADYRFLSYGDACLLSPVGGARLLP